jgi:hypothetical protein
MMQFKKAAAQRWRFLIEVRDHGAIPFRLAAGAAFSGARLTPIRVVRIDGTPSHD